MTTKQAVAWMSQPGIMAGIHDRMTREAVKTLINMVGKPPEQMTLFDFWQYEEDNGHLMCKCPKCEGRMILHIWTYHNPYSFCPYCATPLDEGEMAKAYKRVYGGEMGT